MIVAMFVLGWLALSIVAVLAYAFGATVGYRRGVEQGRAEASAGFPSSRSAGSADIAVELRLPEEAHRAT